MPHRRATLVALLALATCCAHPSDTWARTLTVPRALDAMARDGDLDPHQHKHYENSWKRARRAVRRLRGAPRTNLDGVLASASSLARRRMLPPRVVPVFLTIERNYEWFWRGRRPAALYGARRTFGNSPVIFQFYPGSGWQIQPLANFGRLNGLAASKGTDPEDLRRYAEDMLALSVQRGGFRAFEYYFPWSGGAPGWISGMTTATGLSAFARVARRTGDGRYTAAGEQMLGAFFERPPDGVKVSRGHGRVHYLQYSQSPRLLVGNAFAQTLIGLDEFAEATADRHARLALGRGLKQADANIARYDTGAWSLYWRRPGTSGGAESDLHYHELFADFLSRLCKRFPGRDFCGLRARFARYETEPVALRLSSRPGRRTLKVRTWASKRGSGTLTLRLGGRIVRRTRLSLTRGYHVVRWHKPDAAATYELTIDAVSLNGVAASASRAVRVR